MLKRSRTRARLTTATTLLVIALSTSVAWGHKGDVNGIYPLYGEGGVLIGAATSVGLLRVEGEKLTLFEPNPDPIVWAATGPGGRVFSGGSFGVRVTTDWGCTWTAAAGPLGTTETLAVTHARSTTTLELLATSGPGAPNALYRAAHTSEDTTLEAMDGTRIEGRYTSLLRRERDGLLLATSVDRAFAASPRLHLGDGANGWLSLPLELEPGAVPRLLTSLEGDAVVLAVFVPERPGADKSISDTLKSDGTESLFRLSLVDGSRTPIAPPVDLIRWTNAIFEPGEPGLLVTDSEDAFYQYNGENLLEASREPRACLFRHPLEDTLMTCGERPFPFIFHTTRDARSWEGMLPFESITVAECSDPTLTMTLDKALETDRLDPGVPLDQRFKATRGEAPGETMVDTPAPPPRSSPEAAEGGCAIPRGGGVGWLGLVLGAGLWFTRR